MIVPSRLQLATVASGSLIAFTLAGVTPALAASTGSSGQPSQTCGVTTGPGTPGSSVSAPGSAFNPNGVSGAVYAGNSPQTQSNPKSVSQYDVACFQVSPLAP